MKFVGIGSLLVVAYFLFFPSENSYTDFNGARYESAKFNENRSLEIAAIVRSDRFLGFCGKVSAKTEQRYETACLDAMEDAGFELPPIQENAACEVHLPAATLELNYYGQLKDRTTLEDLSAQLPCQPEFVGRLPWLEPKEREIRGIFTRDFVVSYEPHEREEIHIYSISSGQQTRYAGFLKIYDTFRMVGITQAGHDDVEFRRENPVELSIDSDLFTDAIIALGRANARGCGSFRLFSNGIAECDGGTKWRVNFGKQEAVRQW